MGLYQKINISLDLGDGFLSPECAYFLGAILSADESFIKDGKRYWLVPVRHNYGQNIEEQIKEHMRLLQQIIGRANGEIFTRDEMKGLGWFGSNLVMRAFMTKQGFSAVFESGENSTVNLFLENIKTIMNNSSQEIFKAFLAGAFDGRSTPDISQRNNSIRYLALDCENPDVANYLSTILSYFSIESNYNTARDRVEGGRPRKAQLRILGNDVILFMKKSDLFHL